MNAIDASVPVGIERAGFLRSPDMFAPAMIPVAAGAAYALKHNGTDRVAVNFIGDGGTSTGASSFSSLREYSSSSLPLS